LSSDGNGYRLGLLDLLTSAGNTVQYIGSVQAGNMSDNFNEGHSGAVISQIAEYAKLSLPEDPNLVLLMAGTNDINDFLNITTAPYRLSGLIDEITSAVPNVTVIVAQITPAANTTVDAAMVTFNSKIPGIVASKVAVGQKVSTVNMMDYVTADDLVDGLHPTGYGYQQMAKAWFAGIQEVQKKGWIDSPIPTNVTRAVTLAIQTSLATSTSTSTHRKSASDRQFALPVVSTNFLSVLAGYFLYA
jgi:lysophospholipase L1-like esterase